MCKNFFTVRVTEHWNRLPRGVVLWSLLHWKHSRPAWVSTHSAWPREPALAGSWTQRSLEVPSSPCNSVISSWLLRQVVVLIVYFFLISKALKSCMRKHFTFAEGNRLSGSKSRERIMTELWRSSRVKHGPGGDWCQSCTWIPSSLSIRVLWSALLSVQIVFFLSVVFGGFTNVCRYTKGDVGVLMLNILDFNDCSYNQHFVSRVNETKKTNYWGWPQ